MQRYSYLFILYRTSELANHTYVIVTSDLLEIIEADISTYKNVQALPGDIEQFSSRVVAAIETPLYLINTDIYGRAMYFNSYLGNRKNYSSSDDSMFQIIMDYNKLAAENNSYVSNALWLLGKDSWMNHIGEINCWAECLYQLEQAIVSLTGDVPEMDYSDIESGSGQQVVDLPEYSDNGVCGESVQWYLDTSGNLYISGNGEMTSHPWTEEYKNSVVKVIISDEITNICSQAFYQATGLSEVILGKDIESIGSYAFYGTALSGALVLGNTPGLQVIGNGSFGNCDGLTSVTIRGNINNIGEYTFNGCDSIKEVIIEKLDVSMNTKAFSCSHLINVTLPVETEYTHAEVFSGSPIETIHYTFGDTGIMPDRNSDAESEAYYQNTLEFSCYRSLKKILFDEGVKRIGAYAYHQHSSNQAASQLTDIQFPSTLESIGEYAFSYQLANGKGIDDLVLPEGLTKIGPCAFMYNKNIKKVVFPISLEEIGYSAFEQSNLAGDLMLDAARIGGGAFAYCRDLTSVVFSNNVECVKVFL